MGVNRKGRLQFGDFELDILSGKLCRDGRPVKIQPQPLRVLTVLLERPGEIVSREDLRARIWGTSTFVEFDQGLNYCVRHIRLALGDEASEPIYIETLPKQGYRFIAPIASNGHIADPVPIASSVPSGTRSPLWRPFPRRLRKSPTGKFWEPSLPGRPPNFGWLPWTEVSRRA
jgi:DNA-binding winged helix-turn-helix (wHTH) protein